MAVGDMNGDGIPDIVTNGITILLGDGKGGFPTRKDFLDTDRDSVILTDFDGDGKMDVLIGNGNPLVLASDFRYEGTLTVFFGDGAGGLTAAPLAPADPATLRAVPFNLPMRGSGIALASADFNKDGIADLALVSDFQYLSVFLGSASGAITPVFTYDFSHLRINRLPRPPWSRGILIRTESPISRCPLHGPQRPGSTSWFSWVKGTALSWRRSRAMRPWLHLVAGYWRFQ